jgi:hypothetical protein
MNSRTNRAGIIFYLGTILSFPLLRERTGWSDLLDGDLLAETRQSYHLMEIYFIANLKTICLWNARHRHLKINN